MEEIKPGRQVVVKNIVLNNGHIGGGTATVLRVLPGFCVVQMHVGRQEYAVPLKEETITVR